MFCLTPKPSKEISEIIGVFLWPPSSPDFNPLDYAEWGVLRNKTNATYHQNIGSLKTAFQEEWNKMSEQFILKVCKFFRRCVDIIIEKWQPYWVNLLFFVYIPNLLLTVIFLKIKMRIQGVALKTYQRRCTIGRSGGRGLGISVPTVRHDDDDYYYTWIFLILLPHPLCRQFLFTLQQIQILFSFLNIHCFKYIFTVLCAPMFPPNHHVFFSNTVRKSKQKNLSMFAWADNIKEDLQSFQWNKIFH